MCDVCGKSGSEKTHRRTCKKNQMNFAVASASGQEFHNYLATRDEGTSHFHCNLCNVSSSQNAESHRVSGLSSLRYQTYKIFIETRPRLRQDIF